MREVPLTGFLGDDLNHQLTFIGLDLTGAGISFGISPGPDQTVIISPAATLLDVESDEDGVPVSKVQVFAPASYVRAAVDNLGGLEDGLPVILYHQLQLSGIPGDLGSQAKTTIIFGDYTFRGEVIG